MVRRGGGEFPLFDLKLYPLADADSAVAQVKAEGIIKSTGRTYRQEYVVFLRVVSGKIVFLREYFDPTRAAQAMETPILGLGSVGEQGNASNENL